MRRSTPVLLALVILCVAGRRSSAAGSDSSQLTAAIDQQIESRLNREALRPAELADDAEFLRRAYLDLNGVVPTRDQTDQFLSDSDPAKRSRLVDALLASPRYGQYMADVWQGYLISPLADDQRARASRFRDWLAGQFNTTTWDRIATELLTATGKMEQNPAVTYLIEGRLPRGVPDLTDLTSRYFMGVRLNCAQCHDHPFVKFKQQDFWSMAAFFTQIQTPRRAKQVYERGVVDDPTLTLATLRDAGVPDGFVLRLPTFLDGQKPPAGSDKTPHRAALAAWLTSPGNPYFSRAMVNRTWWRLLGRGIVQPVDDMHDANPPSHPELLELLARQFADSGFDLKFLTRAIVLSRTYQRTSRPGDAPEKQAALFGRMSIKVLSAGQIYDSLETIFGAATKVNGIDARQGARPEFTEFFGETGDPDPSAYRRGIPHLLRQMNSGQFAGRNLDSLVERLSASGRPPDAVAADLFLTILSRRPTADEMEKVKAYVGRADAGRGAFRELAWVLMMTSEFSMNH
jgi:hypothetical protein